MKRRPSDPGCLARVGAIVFGCVIWLAAWRWDRAERRREEERNDES